MSDYEDRNSESEMSEQNEQIIEESVQQPKTGHYKSKKGDADKRKETSRANAAKARLAKLAKLKEQKKSQEYDRQFEYEESTDDSESEEEELRITRAKPKSKAKEKKQLPAKQKKDPIADRFSRLEEMIAQMASAKSKPKKVAKKTVIHNHVHSAPPKAAPSKKAFMIDLID